MQLPRRLIGRLRLRIEPVDTAHSRGSAFDDLRFEMMYKVEHRFDKRTATETDQRDALPIGSVGTCGVPDGTVEQEYGAFRCGESDLIRVMSGTGRWFDSLEMDTGGHGVFRRSPV